MTKQFTIMKVFTTLKKALFTLALLLPLGNASWSQVVVSESFEQSCSNYYNSFYLGCIPNWISTSGTPDNNSPSGLGTAYQGSRFVNAYANWNPALYTPAERSEGIALNYSFQAGTTYKISYAVKGGSGANPATQTYTAKWILTNGMVNQSGGLGAPQEATPAIPSGSQQLPNMSFNGQGWTVNTQTFTATANFSQLWLRQWMTSSVSNSYINGSIQLDDFKLEIICTPTLAITGANSFCQGATMSFTGAVTNGCSITNNVWTVVESDQFGTPASGATEWWSPWATGTPGVLNIPSASSGGPTMTCGKYYRIKLAVQNAYTNWTETTKIIYVNCPPSFKLKGSTSRICTGEQATLNATLNSGNPVNYTLNWTPITPAGPSIYNGPMAGVVASPSVTTTYLVTVTDNITGCSASAQWTVTVENNDPAFAITTNPSNSSYLQITASPLVTSGHPSGFGYMWLIEELNSSGTPVYSTNSNVSTVAPCWWTGNGAPTTFSGFNGLTQTTSNSCSPANGMFKYNTSYRITRGVWSTNCTWAQVSYTLIYQKSGEWVFVEDHKAPDMSAAVAAIQENKQIQLTLSPNPATDLVSISVHTSTTGELNVTDLSGRIVFSTKLKAGSEMVELQVGNYSPGTYLVNVVEDNNLRSTEKLVITE